MISHDHIKTILWMIINFVSSVWIIWSMKVCFQEGFRFSTALTALHFLLTYIGLEVSACLNFFERKSVPFLGVIPLSIAFCGFIVFNNMSLQYNTIGIYQITKVLTTPAIVLIHMVFYKRYLKLSESVALFFVCAGVIIATEANLELNTAGITSGLLGVISSSVYQIWIETKQADFHCSPAQLLYYQAPISFILLLPVVYYTEPLHEILAFKFTYASTVAIFGSAILAFLVNLSAYAVIGATSPLTYNMVGHSKLVVIILSSYLLFGERQSLLGISGIFAAIVGIVTYAHVRMTAQADAIKKKNEEFFQLAEKLPLVRLQSEETSSTADV